MLNLNILTITQTISKYLSEGKIPTLIIEAILVSSIMDIYSFKKV